MTDLQKVITDQIIAERDRQDKKWGAERRLSDHHWACILGEEFGEACQAANDHLKSELVLELIQVAAVAINWIECLSIAEAESCSGVPI